MHKIKYFLVAEKFFKCNLHCRYIRRLEIIFCEAAAYDVAAVAEEVHIPGAVVEVSAAYDVAAVAEVHIPDAVVETAAYDVAAEVEEVHIPGAVVETAAYDVAAAADDDVFDANIHVPDVPFLYVPALFHVPAFLLHDL